MSASTSSEPSDPFVDGLPTLLGPRVRLRHVAPDDVAALFRVFGDAETMQWWSHPPLPTLEAAQAYHERIEEGVRSRARFQWVVTEREGGRLLGTSTLFRWEPEQRRAEIGYILHRDHWGQGLGSEAVHAVLGFAFGTLRLHRVEADIDPANAGSIRLVERLGFVREGHLRERWWTYGEPLDSYIYGLLARDYRGPDVHLPG